MLRFHPQMHAPLLISFSLMSCSCSGEKSLYWPSPSTFILNYIKDTTQWKQSPVVPCLTINKCILYYSYKGNVRTVQFNLLKLTKALHLLHREGMKKKGSARRKKF